MDDNMDDAGYLKNPFTEDSQQFNDSFLAAMRSVRKQPAAVAPATSYSLFEKEQLESLLRPDPPATAATSKLRRSKGPITADERQQYEHVSANDLVPLHLNSWRQLTAAIPGLNTSEELSAWLASDSFREPFVRYLEGYLIPHQTDNTRGDGYGYIKQVIFGDVKAKTKALLRPKPESTEKWSAEVWTAACIRQIYDMDDDTVGSLFAGATMYDEQKKYVILWKIVQKASSDASVPRRQALLHKLRLSETEIDRLNELAKSYPMTEKQKREMDQALEKRPRKPPVAAEPVCPHPTHTVDVVSLHTGHLSIG